MWIRLGGQDHRDKENTEIQVICPTQLLHLSHKLALSSYIYFIAQERKTYPMLRGAELSS